MKVNLIRLLYFSPTRTSAKITHAIAEGMKVPYVESDITYSSASSLNVVEELTVIAVPVYGGRVPDTAIARLKQFRSDGKAAVPVVIYGNRDYDDALLELNDLVKSSGFIPVASGAFIGEHSFSRKNLPIAAGRPDEKDIQAAVQFGEAIRKKLDSDGLSGAVQVKGNYPYKEKNPSVPKAPFIDGHKCTRCDACIDVCPVEAILIEADGEMVNDPARCIQCCACVKQCPEEARSFDSPFALVLFEKFKTRREPELFF